MNETSIEADRVIAASAGDSFIVHMDREPLNDTVTIRQLECDRLISWAILDRTVRRGHVRP